VLVFLSGCLLVHWLVFGPNGDAIGGWALDPTQLHVGFARLMYPFFSGLLLFRISKLTQIKHAFIWCSLLVIVALSLPRFGGEQQLWMNGLYESMVILFVFPLIIYLGASSMLANTFQKRACKFLGDISYPIYITHYPLIYLYTGWVYDNKPSFESRIIFGAVVFVAALLIAYACLKLYDEPVRKWLQQKFMPKSKSTEMVDISAKLN